MKILKEEMLGDYANKGYSIKENGEYSITILFEGYRSVLGYEGL